MSCGVDHRRDSDPALLWLGHRLVATTPIRPLAWEHPCAAGASLKSQKKKASAMVSDCSARSSSDQMNEFEKAAHPFRP